MTSVMQLAKRVQEAVAKDALYWEGRHMNKTLYFTSSHVPHLLILWGVSVYTILISIT